MRKSDVLAIQLRYEGKKAEEIATVIGSTAGTVANYFMIGGKLYQSYREYEEKQNTLHHELLATIREEASQYLQKSLKKAAEVMVQLLESDDPMIRLRAARELLDRGFGRPTQQQQEPSHAQEWIDQMMRDLGIDEEHITEESFANYQKQIIA